MFSVWQSVKVKSESHSRAGQAGTVQATNPAKPDDVVVKFDTDGQLESVACADLAPLGSVI